MKRIGENRINDLHKELRTKMFESGLQGQMITGMNMKQIKKFLEGLKSLVGYSSFVIMEEERSFFPNIISVAPFMIPLLEQEHSKMAELGEKICILADDYEEAYADSERMNTIMSVIIAYHEWMAFMMQHLLKEEMIMRQVNTEETREKKPFALVAA